MNNTTYLLTGAAGFLGSHICRQLTARDDKVRALVLEDDPGMEYLPDEAEICIGDLCDVPSLERFFDIKGNIVVIHCASIVTVDPSYNQKVMDVNVTGTENIIRLTKAHSGGKRLVYVGSSGTIPELPMGTAQKEPERYEPENIKDCCGKSKAMASQLVLDAAKDGLDCCITMPTGIMGPGDYAIGSSTASLIRILNGELPAGIDGSFNLVDVRDLAHGIILAADKGKSGESYLLANELVSFRDFCRILSEECGWRLVEKFLSIDEAYKMAENMEKEAEKIGTKPLMTRFSIYALARNNVYDYSKAKSELGYSTRSYSETLRDAAKWLRDLGKINTAK